MRDRLEFVLHVEMETYVLINMEFYVDVVGLWGFD